MTDGMDDRTFFDTYDLYRPTVAKSATHEDVVTVPSSATASGLPCLFMPRDMGGFDMARGGVMMDFDAALLIPSSDTLYPEDRADAPDVVYTSGRYWVVLTVTDSLGRGQFKRALLRERRA